MFSLKTWGNLSSQTGTCFKSRKRKNLSITLLAKGRSKPITIPVKPGIQLKLLGPIWCDLSNQFFIERIMNDKVKQLFYQNHTTIRWSIWPGQSKKKKKKKKKCTKPSGVGCHSTKVDSIHRFVGNVRRPCSRPTQTFLSHTASSRQIEVRIRGCGFHRGGGDYGEKLRRATASLHEEMCFSFLLASC